MKDKIKIHILFEFKEGPWGGGNQFLKAIRDYFIEEGVYTNNIDEADVILFNSNQPSLRNIKYIKQLYKAKYKNNKTLINRIDGPIRMTRKGFDIFDEIILIINNLFIDACVFQSSWSMKKMKEIGDFSNVQWKLIMNIPDDNIFFPKFDSDNEEYKNKRIKIIATSWSSRYYEKGFHILEYLDNNLDFKKYDMTFVGNTSVKFKNINYIPPVASVELAKILREHQIFFTASINDACSNSLIEGLQCGLPAVYINSGGNPEIVGDAGVSFESKEDVIEAINIISKNIDFYKSKIKYRKTKDVCKEYYDFFEEIFRVRQANKNYQSINMKNYISYLLLLFTINKLNLANSLKSYFNMFVHKLFRKNAS